MMNRIVRSCIFSEHLPHQTSSEDIRHRLVKIISRSARSIKISGAGKRMKKKIITEPVFVPFPAVCPEEGVRCILPGIKSYFRPVQIEHIMIEEIEQNILQHDL